MGAIGWYGKLPSAGDFLCRRLPTEFQGPWDHWLQRGLAHGRHAHGERWSDTYLTFPVWRFVLPAGHLGPGAWCGVLMPSVDRVGRLFPLTICEGLPAGKPLPGLRSIDAHLAQFAHAGLDAIDGMSVDDFDLRLGALRPMPPDRNPADGVRLDAFLGSAATGCWTLDEPLAQALAGAAERIMLEGLSDRALWWLPPDDVGPGRMRLVRLPLTPAVLDELITNPMHAIR